jgi:hypothetical protein
VVWLSIIWLVDDILFLVDVRITSDESIAVNRVPVNEEVDDRTVIS